MLVQAIVTQVGGVGGAGVKQRSIKIGGTVTASIDSCDWTRVPLLTFVTLEFHFFCALHFVHSGLKVWLLHGYDAQVY